MYLRRPLLLRLLALVGPAALAACDGSGDASDLGSATNANAGAGGTPGAAGSGGSASGGAGGAGAGGSAAGGASASCKDGEKRFALQFCDTSACSDVMMEICKQGAWSCYKEPCSVPPGTGGAAGAGGAGGAGASGGSAGAGGYSNPVCPTFCGQACAQTQGICGSGADPEVQALFQNCTNISGLSEAATQTTDSAGVTSCCWQDLCPGGRPLLVEGELARAPVARRGDWG